MVDCTKSTEDSKKIPVRMYSLTLDRCEIYLHVVLYQKKKVIQKRQIKSIMFVNQGFNCGKLKNFIVSLLGERQSFTNFQDLFISY